MAKWKHYYLVRIEFIGFRYHGWQVQPNLNSVHKMIDKTFNFIFKGERFKTLGAGRTDAKVSADDFALELFLDHKIDEANLLTELNFNLPADIRAKSIVEVDEKFNVISDSKVKEYHYIFSGGGKIHPFNAPYMFGFRESLDIELMKEAAQIFEGVHNFKRYTVKDATTNVFEREILSSKIEINNKIHTSYIPKETYIFKVKSKGFLRYQVRLMMGALVDVGKGEWTLEDLEDSLIKFDGPPTRHIVPSSGLTLHKIDFE